ncbi:SCO3870 family protein [Streptomyces roseifaciens]|uniref:SCO3870 family protein n=1 Tax=Streptomyces roseifaciens TaxID=1488406 RepID=UPI0007182313|nr:SCO3870 family protein [Streptomyces roseifaciens]
MKQVPFGALSAGLAVLGTALVSFAFQLRADGYEQYVQDVAYVAGTAYFTAIMTVVTWVRARRRPLS